MDTTQESWLGEFLSSSSHEEAIPCLVGYSHSEGVTVRFLKRVHSQWIKPSVMHGIIETGQECTLLGPVCLPGIGPETYNQHHDGITVASGVLGYQYFVIGKHIDLNDKIGKVSFTFPNLGEFATGLDTYRQTHEVPLAYCEQTIIGKMSVWRQDSGVFMLDIKEAVHSSNRAALERLSMAHDEIRNELGASFSKRQTAEYRVILEFPSETNLPDACKSIQKLVDLFSILLYGPVMAMGIVGSKGALGDRTITVYRSLVLDERTLNIIESRRTAQKIPIALNTIPLAGIVKTWIDENEKYSSLVSGIQSRTSVKAVHEVYAELILCCAFMESITHEVGLDKNKKYEDCIRNYACNGLQQKILVVFNLDSIEKVGVAISEVRADIVHFKGTRKWLNKIPTAILCQLSQYLELTVIGYLLERLGVDRELIEKYQMLQSETFWTGI
jgi:hypothetical protein